MVLIGNNAIREDVFREELDEKLAPSLGGVVRGLEPEIYGDAERFFSITLVTEQIAEIIANIANVLTTGEGTKVILLSAYFGGGKTHTLISLYHALTKPWALKKAVAENRRARELIDNAIEKLANLSKTVSVVVIDGHMESLAPYPGKPLNVTAYKVQTLWGYIAHSLGSYSELKVEDEKVVPPSIEALVRLFSNKKVVILVDEIAAYIKSLYTSSDQSLKEYASAISTFMERLAKAVEVSQNVVLVVSLPTALSGDEIKGVEKGYEIIVGILESVVKALSRVSPRYIEPVTPRNIPALLQTRLFTSIDSSRRSQVKSSLVEAYQSGEVFDSSLAKRVSDEIEDTYPFHPLYIETLVDILDKHEHLQKTRDLLRISRMILRNIAKDSEGYELVMPWHIDLTNPSIATYLLKGYEGFKVVIETDLLGRAKRYDKRYLSEIIAKALLARTYVYGGVLTPRVAVFPTPYELAVMVYEPYTFQVKELLPKDIIDAIEWMKQNLVYVLEDEKSKRLWFTQYMTPVKYIEERAQHVAFPDAVKEVVEIARKLLVQSIEMIESRRGRRVERSSIFDEELSTVSYGCENLEYDTQRYIVYACIDMPEEKSRRLSKLENIMYKTKSGGIRRYANIIYIVYPSSRERLQLALENAKKVIACREVEESGVIDELIKSHGQNADIVREVFKNKIKSYCSKAYSDTLSSTLNMFDLVAYPSFSDEENRNIASEVRIQPRETIIGGVEYTLANIQPNKIFKSIDFDTLAHYLRRIGVDLTKAGMAKSVSEIIEYFYTNPMLPITTIDAIKGAIAEGVRRLEVGLKCHERIYYKTIDTCHSEAECLGIGIAEGETVGSFSDDCMVLPWSEALVEQMKTLKKTYDSNRGVVIEYYVNYGGELKRVEDVLANIDKYDLDALRIAPLLRLERRVSVAIRPETMEVDARPGEEIEKRFVIERVGPFVGEVMIDVEKGSVEPQKIAIDDSRNKAEIIWRFRAPETEGDLNIVLRVRGVGGSEIASSKIVVRVRSEKVRCLKGLPEPGTRFREMVVEVNQLNLRPLQILSARFKALTIASGILELVMKRGDKETRVSLNVEGIGADDMLKIATSIVSTLSLGEVKLLISLRLRSSNYYVMPSLSENELRDLQPFVSEVCVE